MTTKIDVEKIYEEVSKEVVKYSGIDYFYEEVIVTIRRIVNPDNTLTTPTQWNYASYPPNFVESRLCNRKKLASVQHNCFHVISTGCKRARVAYCFYLDEDRVEKLRKHRIGNCPDSTYTKIE